MTKNDERILKKLAANDMLYIVPLGADDDWYWMYATVAEGKKKHSYVVTNDMMRDHKVAFMEPR